LFSVIREIHFSYGHRVLGHKGPCGYLHGHNGRAQIEVSSATLDELNMVVDFAKIKETIGSWIKAHFDHRMILWSQDPLHQVLKQAGEPVVVTEENPTAEALAKLIYQEAKRLQLPVTKVILWETENSCASYHE